MSTADVLLRLWGPEDSPDVPEKTIKDLVEFSLSGNERQINVVYHKNSAKAVLPVAGKDVNQGAVVVRLLSDEVHPEVCLQAIKCLAGLAVSPETQVKIAAYPGVLDALVSQLENADREAQEHTARCLAELAQTQTNCMKMASFSVLDPLVKVLENDAPPQVHEQTARCVANLTQWDTNLERIANYPGVLDALATLLDKRGSSSVLKQTVQCLSNLATSSKIQLKIVSDHPAVINSLLRLLGDNVSADVKLQSVRCLTILADHYQKNKEDIASHPGVLEALVKLLKQGGITKSQITLQTEAANCLLKLLLAPENLVKVGCNSSAIDAVVTCLAPRSRRMSKVQNLALDCLRNLAGAPENCLRIIRFPGALSALVDQLVQNTNSEGQELAALCLSRLSIPNEAKAVLTLQPGLLKALVALFGIGHSAMREPIRCLMNLAQSDHAVRERIASQPGVIDSLMKVLARQLDVEALENTTKCLSLLSESYKNSKLMFSHPNILVSLVNLLQLDATAGVLEYTAECLTNLANSEETQVKMASFPGMLNALVLSLSVRNELTGRVREQVLRCLAQLSAPPANQTKIASYPGVNDALRRLVAEDVNFRERTQALLCLENLRLSLPSVDTGRSFRRTPTGLQRYLNGESLPDPDEWEVDPLTCEKMCDPVKCSDGRTYDRWTIINNRMVIAPYDRSLQNFTILIDDYDVRSRLFRNFPQQEAKFRTLRESYREKALESVRARDVEDAIERLNNVLMWAPSDMECRSMLDRLLNRLDESSPDHLTQNQEQNVGALSHTVAGSSRVLNRVPSPPPRTSRIPVLLHEELVSRRAKEGARSAFVWIIVLFMLYFLVFIPF